MSAKLDRIMVFATILLLAGPALAQETTGNLEGVVVDERGSPVPDADVVATGTSLQGARHASADSRGLFRLIELPVGAYRVEISRVGYRDVTYDDVQIGLGKTTSLGETRLVPEAQELPPLIVSAPQPTIDPYSTTLGFNFVAKDYEVLPTERDYRSLATQMPHANESFLGDEVNFADATGHENKYFIDGVEVTNGYTAHTGMPLPYNFVEETQVRMGGYEAEHRSSLGGVMDVITLSVEPQALSESVRSRRGNDDRTCSH